METLGVGPLDAALATAFASHRIADTLTAMSEQADTAEPDHEAIRARALLAECNTKRGRPGGGGIIPGFRFQTGIDLNEAAVMAQLGEALPAAAPTTTSLIGYVMVYQRAGWLEATPPAPDDPWIVELVYHHRAGDTLPMPSRWSDAVASATVTGATEAEVLDRLDRIVRHVGDATQVDGAEAHPRPAG